MTMKASEIEKKVLEGLGEEEVLELQREYDQRYEALGYSDKPVNYEEIKRRWIRNRLIERFYETRIQSLRADFACFSKGIIFSGGADAYIKARDGYVKDHLKRLERDPS